MIKKKNETHLGEIKVMKLEKMKSYGAIAKFNPDENQKKQNISQSSEMLSRILKMRSRLTSE